MTLECVQADWTAPGCVHALTTTRAGGVSEPPFDALNLGLHVGDDSVRVQKNRLRLESALMLPSKPRWLNQTHGTIVADLDALPSDHSVIDADGACTATSGVVLSVLTADCLPVVITNQSGTRIAAVHAGWRGLAGGVLASAIARFSREEPLLAWLGPAIGATAFEVGSEVRQEFIESHPENESAFVSGAREGKWMGDLYALASMALTRLGAIEIAGGQHCTVSESARFHSHRRDGIRSGRMATLAWLDPKDS